MITSMWAFGKANASGGLKMVTRAASTSTPKYASEAAAAASKPPKLQEDHATQRELFMDVLSANATRRDAKQYLARFKPPKEATGKAQVPDVHSARNARQLERLGVNLGGLYAPSRAIADAAKFVREDVQEKATAVAQQTLHVALVCLRAPETLDDATIEGLATTLSQLVKLDMRIVLVLELATDGHDTSIRARRSTFAQQADRLSKAIRRHSLEAPRFVTGALEVGDESEKVKVLMPKLLLGPLKRDLIPIVPALAYTPTGQLIKAGVGDVMAALTELLSTEHSTSDNKDLSRRNVAASLDRIIVLDPAGGVPSKDRSDNAHVFINLNQEYEDIEKELSEYAAWDDSVSRPNMYDKHLANVRMLNTCLGMLPPASSGLIISPQEAATSSQASQERQDTIGTGTRRQKNTLIHNLLTNKPMVSSSLPTARLSTASESSTGAAPVAAATATLVKRGMPLAMIPAVERGQGWQVPSTGTTSLDLQNDPRIDFPRLLHLINDSFRRKLDVDHYLNRVRGRVAGIIVAGAYEGGAILTWETPPNTPTHHPDPSRLVPYLDKFAVLQSSQGSSGVADILFQSMVRSCFPRGVCWRSRKDNPVNKWYFERCAGSWQIPGTQWTMFWTGEGVVEDEGRWRDYVGVCKGVEPSWADGKRPD